MQYFIMIVSILFSIFYHNNAHAILKSYTIDTESNAIVINTIVIYSLSVSGSCTWDLIADKEGSPRLVYLALDQTNYAGTTYINNTIYDIQKFNGLAAKGRWDIYLDSNCSNEELNARFILDVGFDNDGNGKLGDPDDDDDGDGMANDWESSFGLNKLDKSDANIDLDGDHLVNLNEYIYFKNQGKKIEYLMHPRRSDTDNDDTRWPLYDDQEVALGTMPNEIDSDGDTMPDGWEVFYYLDFLSPDGLGDQDRDGLLNKDEFKANTNPRKSDTDNDGMPDGWEWNYYSFYSSMFRYCVDPTLSDGNTDCENDGLTNFQEYTKGTDPGYSDTNNNGIKDDVDAESWGNGPIGQEPKITLSKSSDWLGSININNESSAHTFNVTNTGFSTLYISEISLGGISANDYNLSHNCPQLISPKSFCTLTAKFKPRRVGLREATISIISNDPVSNIKNINLSGRGVFNIITLFPVLFK